MKFKMKKLSAIAVTLSILSASVAATSEPQPTFDEEKAKVNNAIGLGSGVLLGAAVAGPAGAIVAGFIGVLVSDDVNDHDKLTDAEFKLAMNRSELRKADIALQQLKQQKNLQITRLEEVLNELENQKTRSPEIIANVQFETASFLIQEHYTAQLDAVAQHLKSNPALKVRLSGFADQRGESNYNQILSEQRNEAVRAYLLGRNVSEHQIITEAFGESNAVNQSGEYEKHFFDRRVTLQISNQPTKQMTAATEVEL